MIGLSEIGIAEQTGLIGPRELSGQIEVTVPIVFIKQIELIGVSELTGQNVIIGLNELSGVSEFNK